MPGLERVLALHYWFGLTCIKITVCESVKHLAELLNNIWLCCQKSTKTVHARVMKRLPSKLYNVPCKTPVVDPKLLPFLKENSVSSKAAYEF